MSLNAFILIVGLVLLTMAAINEAIAEYLIMKGADNGEEKQ